MALYKNKDWNNIGVTKGKKQAKKMKCMFKRVQVTAPLAEISFELKTLCRNILNIMCLIMFTQATGFYIS